MTAEQSDESQEAFEKARFDYCWMVYQSEVERQQRIETKVQFYLSLVTLFLGVVFLNFGSINTIGKLFRSGNVPVVAQYIVGIALGFLAVALLIALICILWAYWLREGSAFYPKEFRTSLFSDESEYLPQKKICSLYYMNARSLALAIEDRRKNNSKRTNRLCWVQTSTVIAVLALAIVIGILVVYSLS